MGCHKAHKTGAPDVGEITIEYKVSSGSLNVDFELGGGLGPGLHRFIGMNEGGKTSEALEVTV